jgi:transcriptional regulator with XRE-family HTH domain
MLREARESVGLSQVQIAFMLGVHQSLVSRIEKTGGIEHVLLERYACLCNKNVSAFSTLDQAAGSKPSGQEKGWLYYSETKNKWEYLIKNGSFPSAEGLKKFDLLRLPEIERLELQRFQLANRIQKLKRDQERRKLTRNARPRTEAK